MADFVILILNLWHNCGSIRPRKGKSDDSPPPGPDGAPGAFSPNPKGGFLRIVETVGTREQLGVGPHGLDLPAATNRLEGVPGVNRQEIEVWDIAERKRVEHTESAKKGKPQ